MLPPGATPSRRLPTLCLEGPARQSLWSPRASSYLGREMEAGQVNRCFGMLACCAERDLGGSREQERKNRVCVRSLSGTPSLKTLPPLPQSVSEGLPPGQEKIHKQLGRREPETQAALEQPGSTERQRRFSFHPCHPQSAFITETQRKLRQAGQHHQQDAMTGQQHKKAGIVQT